MCRIGLNAMNCTQYYPSTIWQGTWMKRFFPYDVFGRLTRLNIKMVEKERKIQPTAVPLDTLPERCTMTGVEMQIFDFHFYLSQRHSWRFYTPIAANLIARENRLRFSLAIDADTPGDFFRRSRRCGSFENSCDKIAQPDGLVLLAIRSYKRRRSRERAHLANACEFNRRYLTCQVSAILYADRCIKSPSGSLALLSWSQFISRLRCMPRIVYKRYFRFVLIL